MPLITGTVYLFGQILSFALPVGLLLVCAAFYYRQGRRAHAAAPRAAGSAGTASPVSTAGTGGAVDSASTPGAVPPEPPPAPSRPYSDL